MALIPTFQLTGQKEVKRALKKLGPNLSKKPIRKGARAGAKVMAAALKKLTPKGKRKDSADGGKRLKQQVKVRAWKRSRVRVGVSATLGDPDNNKAYLAAVNYERGPGGWHTGRVKGTGFVEQAFEQSKSKASRTAAETIAAETNKELRKL